MMTHLLERGAIPAAGAALLLLFAAASAPAGLQVSLDVRKVSAHSKLVTVVWEAEITSDRDWDGCELLISFRDKAGREIHRITGMVELKEGRNTLTGHEICEAEVWDRTTKFSGRLNCGF
ncbi:MAG: hypothetical protein ACLFUP_08890 [Desulfobacteraceae bacterium]